MRCRGGKPARISEPEEGRKKRRLRGGNGRNDGGENVNLRERERKQGDWKRWVELADGAGGGMGGFETCKTAMSNEEEVKITEYNVTSG
jgi:hypothetical protein